MNSFNKTEAAKFPLQDALPKDFPFLRLNTNYHTCTCTIKEQTIIQIIIFHTNSARMASKMFIVENGSRYYRGNGFSLPQNSHVYLCESIYMPVVDRNMLYLFLFIDTQARCDSQIKEKLLFAMQTTYPNTR